VLGDGRALIGTNAGLALGIDLATGRRLWTVPLRGRVASSPALAGDLALFTTVRGDVVALRAATGDPVWRRRVGSAVESSPLVVDGSAYVGTLAGRVLSLALASGGVLWSAEAAGDVKASLALAGPNVVVGDYAGRVTAFRRSDGRVAWQRESPGERLRGAGRFYAGPAVAYGRVFVGNVNGRVLALDEDTGEIAWVRVLDDLVYSSAAVSRESVVVGSYDHRLYALDAVTGRVRWKFDTIEEQWRYPRLAGGGGAWFPVTVDDDGLVYSGNSNPGPWGGTKRFPNGGMYPGPARWTNSLLVLEGDTGRLRWADQVTPHDVRDYDFQASPILAELDDRKVVFGAGKAGRVIAWDRETRARLWERVVGVHMNDAGPLPRAMTTVCPGLYGGVETPMAYADGRLFVPVVDLCVRGSAVGFEQLEQIDVSGRGTGRLAALDGATGRPLWEQRFADPVFACATVSNDVVFTATFDGWVYGIRTENGRILWRARVRAGINSCPTVSGSLLLVGAGVPHPAFARPKLELVAFGLPG
jgi:alcohol dehydrogenase (cytochrome c)